MCSELRRDAALQRLSEAWRACYGAAHHVQFDDRRNSIRLVAAAEAPGRLMTAEALTTSYCESEVTVRALNQHYLRGARHTPAWLARTPPDAPQDICGPEPGNQPQ